MTDRKAKSVMVLFSGGDASGMNPFLRGLVRLGLNRHAATILGCKDGFRGLLHLGAHRHGGALTLAELRADIDNLPGRLGLWRRRQMLVRMDQDCVRGLASRGGIILGTARPPEFQDRAARRQVIELLKALHVDTVVVCGGNGSLAGAARLAAESQLQVLGVPATIDNDIPFTETALGFDTAVNAVVAACVHVNDTAAAHHRIMVLETMGRDSGELARLAALAAGAEIVVTPERGLLHAGKMKRIAQRLETLLLGGRDHGMVLVAEGIRLEPPVDTSPAVAFGEFLKTHFQRPGSPFPGLEIRVTVLGHLQRGGPPTAADRILAARFAEAAWQAITAHPGRSGVIGLQRGRVVLQPFHEQPHQSIRANSDRLYETFKAISRPTPEKKPRPPQRSAGWREAVSAPTNGQ